MNCSQGGRACCDQLVQPPWHFKRTHRAGRRAGPLVLGHSRWWLGRRCTMTATLRRARRLAPRSKPHGKRRRQENDARCTGRGCFPHEASGAQADDKW